MKKLGIYFGLVLLMLSTALASSVSRTISPSYAAPNNAIAVALSSNVEQGERILLLTEIIPAGITVVDGGGGVYSASGNLTWIEFQASGLLNKTYTYIVSSPAEGLYPFSGKYIFEGMADEADTQGGNLLNVSNDAPPTPTCDDSIRNGNEDGVDCGGNCPNSCFNLSLMNTRLNNLENRMNTSESLMQSLIQSWNAIETQLESVKQWLFFGNWNGDGQTVCDAMKNECKEVCMNECSAGEMGCDSSSMKGYCELKADGCYHKTSEACENGEICEDGVCCSIECSNKRDCGNDTTAYYCSNNDAWQRVITYECIDAGTCDSHCLNTTANTLFDDCDDRTEACQNGKCIRYEPCTTPGAYKTCGQSGCYGFTICRNGFWSDCTSKGLKCSGGVCDARGECVAP